jgi:hypothetical protein
MLKLFLYCVQLPFFYLSFILMKDFLFWLNYNWLVWLVFHFILTFIRRLYGIPDKIKFIIPDLNLNIFLRAPTLFMPNFRAVISVPILTLFDDLLSQYIVIWLQWNIPSWYLISRGTSIILEIILIQGYSWR